MYAVAIICACVLAACAAPPPAGYAPPPQAERRDYAQIVHQESDVDAGGKYHYSFETSDGTKAAQAGELRKIGDDVGEVSSGFFEYTDKDKNSFKVTYTADENGYVATGPHIHGIPEPIARAIKWAAEHPYKEPERKGKH